MLADNATPDSRAAQLGFHINYNKVEGPSQSLTFLGIHMDTVSMTLALPEKKTT